MQVEVATHGGSSLLDEVRARLPCARRDARLVRVRVRVRVKVRVRVRVKVRVRARWPGVRTGPSRPTAAHATATRTRPEEKPVQKSRVERVAMAVKSCRPSAWVRGSVGVRVRVGVRVEVGFG